MAAGQGFKTFAVGEVLSAANVNGYLMQGVLVFANAAARTSAITSPQEGQYSYLKDTNSTEYYTGSAWVAIGGGGSSPLTTKGDLYGFSTLDARIPIGANDTVLTADSTQTLGLKWATPASGSTFVGASAYRSGNFSTATGVYTAIQFNAENFDTNTFHDNTTNNTRMTIPAGKAGKYLITCTVGWQINTTSDRRIGIYKNGGALLFTDRIAPSSVDDTAVSSSVVADLAVADYLEVLAFQGTGGNLNVLGSIDQSIFTITFLGA
jgi:hypothetical protein